MTQTIELTGKKWKKHFILGIVILLSGPIVALLGVNANQPWLIFPGLGLSAVGLLYMLITKVLTWWYHR